MSKMYSIMYCCRRRITALILLSFFVLSTAGTEREIPAGGAGFAGPASDSASIIRSIRPVSPYIPENQTEFEKVISIIHQQSLPERKSSQVVLHDYYSGVLQDLMMGGHLFSGSGPAGDEPPNQMHKALIRYIHHKEDQL